jgi:hypothetical protein
MWSHYADSHRGVCLEFNLAGDESYSVDTHRVVYQEAFPAASFFTINTAVGATAALLTKAAYWRYEAEWRTINVGGSPGFRPFAPPMLTAVTMGAAASEADRVYVSQLSSTARAAIEQRDANIRRGAYALDIVPRS